MSNVEHITVKDDDDGQRLDRWLKRHVPHLPYGLAQKLIRKGQIRIDGKRAKTDTLLTGGASVRIPPIQPRSSEKKEPRLSDKDKKFMRSLIIYEDAHIYAINKPSGLAVQGGTNTKYHLDMYLDALKDKDGVKPRLVHRLDKDTSGIMLLARSANAAKKLGELFHKQKIKKIYYALCSPAPEIPDGVIQGSLMKAGGPNKERMRVDEDGKFAKTEYSVVDNAMGHVAFVAFWPRTGRTHQIRAHAEEGGFPILGDNKYRAGAEPPEGIEIADRLHLHAYSLTFKHPFLSKDITLVAPMPDDLKKSWRNFGFDYKAAVDDFEDI